MIDLAAIHVRLDGDGWTVVVVAGRDRRWRCWRATPARRRCGGPTAGRVGRGTTRSTPWRGWRHGRPRGRRSAVGSGTSATTWAGCSSGCRRRRRTTWALPLFVFTLTPRREAPGVRPAAPRRPQTRRRPERHPSRLRVAAVARAVEYVRAGDVFQVNLSQRFTVRHAGDARPRLRPAAPGRVRGLPRLRPLRRRQQLARAVPAVSPMAAVVTRPIKGTRPNRPGMAEELRPARRTRPS